MQRVQLEDLDARVEVARGVGAVPGRSRLGGGAQAAGGRGRGSTSGTEAVGQIEIGGASGGQVVFETLLVEGLGFGVPEEKGGSVKWEMGLLVYLVG